MILAAKWVDSFTGGSRYRAALPALKRNSAGLSDVAGLVQIESVYYRLVPRRPKT